MRVACLPPPPLLQLSPFMNARRAFQEIDGNRRPNAQFSPTRRAFLLGARAVGTPRAKLARDLGIHDSLIQRVEENFAKTTTTEALPRSGRPTGYLALDERRIVVVAKRQPKLS